MKFEQQANAVKQAMQYKAVLASGAVDSQTELARLSGIPRTTLSAYLRLLRLDGSVRAAALGVEDDDARLGVLTEARLRPLVGLEACEQRRQFRALLASVGAGTGRGSR